MNSNRSTGDNLENNMELKNELLEEKAYLNFLEKFDSKYGKDHIMFLYCPLHQALKYSCLAPVEYRKPLVVYLHNENDYLSQLICPSFVKGEIYNVLERSFDVLAWDLMSIEIGTFDLIVNKWPNLEMIKREINRKGAGLFVISFTEDAVNIISKWDRDQVDLSDILHSLKALEKNRIDHAREVVNKEKQIGPKEFQQMMFDRLGDRDYDSFELDEHDHLKSKIGFSKFGFPLSENGYNKRQKQSIDKTYNMIIKHSSKYAEWEGRVVISFIYNCTESIPLKKRRRRRRRYRNDSQSIEILPVPIYVIRKCYNSSNPCRVFIDHDDRVYSSWLEYINENNLHACFMLVPKGGRYDSATNDGAVQLETYYSPACKIYKTILERTDHASNLLGVVVGVILILGTIPSIAISHAALNAASIIGVLMGIYLIVRSSITIHNRRIHEETMSFANSKARKTYLHLVAGSLGFVGMGTGFIVRQLEANGVNISKGAHIAYYTIISASVCVGLVKLVNLIYNIVDNLIHNRNKSKLSFTQLSSSTLFFENTVCNFKNANGSVNETQPNSMKIIQESLSGNRHRNTVNKFYREGVRTNDCNVEAARVEVITTIKSISTVDETLAVLTRNNKLFYNQGITFAISDGVITLNGIKTDILTLETLSKYKTTQFHIDLPNAPTPTQEQIQTSNFEIVKFLKTNYDNFYTYEHLLLKSNCLNILSQILFDFSYVNRKKILSIFGSLLEKFHFCKIPLINMCQEFCATVSDHPLATVLLLIIQFLNLIVNQQDEVYRKKLNNVFQYDTDKNRIYWTEKTLDIFVNGCRINSYLLDKAFRYIITYVSESTYKTLQDKEKTLKRIRSSNQEVDCTICKGKFLSNTMPSTDLEPQELV